MATRRFRNTTSHAGDPMRVPPDLATSEVPAIQPPRSKLVLLDEADPGYTTQHVLLLADGKSRVISYAAEMSLIASLMATDPEHNEHTAREALAELAVAHNLRGAEQRVNAEGALDWLRHRIMAMANQWSPTELAQALNERAAQRIAAAKEAREKLTK